MSISIEIDVTLPVRGVPFNTLRDLLYAVAVYAPIRYTDALKLVIDEGAIRSTRRQGGLLKKSSFYHYWAALRLLGFIEQSSGINRRYSITDRGQRLLSVAKDKSPFLSVEEKAIFREGMLSSQEIWDNFLVLFTGQRTPSQKPVIGNVVTFRPLPAKKYKKSQYRSYEIHSLFVDHVIIPDDARVCQMIINGLRRWGQQCDLIDEIFPQTTVQSFEGMSFMYLIDSQKEAQLNFVELTSILKRYQKYGQLLFDSTIRFNIPELLVNLCPKEGIRLSKAQYLLRRWVSHYYQDVAIERPSMGLIEEQRGVRNIKKLEQSQPWLEKDNFSYTTLLVRKRLLDEWR